MTNFFQMRSFFKCFSRSFIVVYALLQLSYIHYAKACQCMMMPGVLTLPRDCADIQTITGATTSGTYTVYPNGCNLASCSKTVLCDLTLDCGGWTVIQSRVDNTQDFNQDFATYRDGFGTPNANYWLGNQYVYQVTNLSGTPYQLLIQATPLDSTQTGLTAMYTPFSIASEAEFFTAMLGALFQSGSTVDNMANAQGQPFGTYDQGASFSGVTCGTYQQSGWWFDTNCDLAGDLNAPYDPQVEAVQLQGIVLQTASGATRMGTTRMLIRPTSFPGCV